MRDAGLGISYDDSRLLLWNLVLLVVLSLITFKAPAQNVIPLIDKQISLYKEAYPEIEFKLLLKKSDFEQLLPLTDSLGENLRNADYEHPEEARITLIEAQEYRIGLLLDNGNGSATLFHTPKARITGKPYTCLITYDLSLPDEDPLASTRFMYDIDEEALDSMPESFYLNNQDFLLYTFDHEIFHCIDAYTNGFLFPRTSDPLKACHDRARSELRTEIFSAMAHLSRKPNGKQFLLSLATARTLNLLGGDLEHYTSDTLHRIVESGELNTSNDIKILAEESMQFAENMAPSYTGHKEFHVAVWNVLEEFGVDGYAVLPEYSYFALETPLPEKVKALSGAINEALLAIRSD